MSSKSLCGISVIRSRRDFYSILAQGFIAFPINFFVSSIKCIFYTIASLIDCPKIVTVNEFGFFYQRLRFRRSSVQVDQRKVFSQFAAPNIILFRFSLETRLSLDMRSGCLVKMICLSATLSWRCIFSWLMNSLLTKWSVNLFL